MVPVAIHKVGYYTAGSLRQVIGILLDDLIESLRLDKDDFRAVGRELEALDARLVVSELFPVASVWVHSPNLSSCEECDTLASLNPCRVGFVFR